MKRILLLLALLLPVASHASKLDLFVMGGPSFSDVSNNSNIRINQDMVNEYNTRSNSMTSPLIGAGVAYPFDFAKQKINVALGLSAYYANVGKVKGIEHPFINDGLFDSLNYQFNTRSFSTMLESRLAYTMYDWQPYVIAGIGIAWNHLYNYSETPSIPADSAATALDTFTGHTNTAFAYELGVGLQKQIYLDTKHQVHYFLTLDYRYLNFGLAELGPASLQTSSNGIQLSPLDTQALMLSLKISGL